MGKNKRIPNDILNNEKVAIEETIHETISNLTDKNTLNAPQDLNLVLVQIHTS